MLKKLYRKLLRMKAVQDQLKAQASLPIQFYNCWEQANEDMYWQQFINARHLLDSHPEKRVAIYSVFGPRSIIGKTQADVKIFYTAENLKRLNFAEYTDHCLSDSSIDLAMGFEVFEDPRYVRFPLWMDYMFSADSTEDDIRRICAKLRYPEIGARQKFCCMVASNSADGLRDEMFNKISQIARIDSSGRYLHNDDTLVTECRDNKVEYLKRYLFNICPENTAAYGYVTEKLFESISVGCIPIYWGAEIADKDIVNEDAVIFWDRQTGGEKALQKLSELYSNPKRLDEFVHQPRLTDDAETLIINKYKEIESKLKMLINR